MPVTCTRIDVELGLDVVLFSQNALIYQALVPEWVKTGNLEKRRRQIAMTLGMFENRKEHAVVLVGLVADHEHVNCRHGEVRRICTDFSAGQLNHGSLSRRPTPVLFIREEILAIPFGHLALGANHRNGKILPGQRWR